MTGVNALAPLPRHVPVVVVGAGQGGLSISQLLKTQGIEHLVFEKHRVGHSWRNERWDSFCLVTPNRQCNLPGRPYRGSDPHGFMLKSEVVELIEDYASFVEPPLREGVAVSRIAARDDGGFDVTAGDGSYTADRVVIAISGYHVPVVPRVAADFPESVLQVQSLDYRSPDALPPGAVLVVGSGQSGCQIAEDLHLAGRKVHLAVGDAPRSPRMYRGRDVTDWLEAMGHYDLAVSDHPMSEKVRRNENHYLTGRDGGREIDLRRFAVEGMSLYGMLAGVDDATVRFVPDLTDHLDHADATYLRIAALIDDYIAANSITAPIAAAYVPCWAPDTDPVALNLAAAGVTSVVWCTGFRMDFGLVDIAAFDDRGYPDHVRGVSAYDGLYFIGLPWLHTWGSGRFHGVARDAAHITDHIAAGLAAPRRRVASG